MKTRNGPPNPIPLAPPAPVPAPNHTEALLFDILTELRAIREQLKTVIDDKNGAACVVTRDKFR